MLEDMTSQCHYQEGVWVQPQGKQIRRARVSKLNWAVGTLGRRLAHAPNCHARRHCGAIQASYGPILQSQPHILRGLVPANLSQQMIGNHILGDQVLRNQILGNQILGNETLGNYVLVY